MENETKPRYDFSTLSDNELALLFEAAWECAFNPDISQEVVGWFTELREKIVAEEETRRNQKELREYA